MILVDCFESDGEAELCGSMRDRLGVFLLSSLYWGKRRCFLRAIVRRALELITELKEVASSVEFHCRMI